MDNRPQVSTACGHLQFSDTPKNERREGEGTAYRSQRKSLNLPLIRDICTQKTQPYSLNKQKNEIFQGSENTYIGIYIILIINVNKFEVINANKFAVKDNQ